MQPEWKTISAMYGLHNIVATNCKCFSIKGSTGTTFTGLSVGNHTIVIRFTPTGSSQTSTLQPPLTFTILPPPTPTPGEHI